LLAWFHERQRTLPWRTTRDPYRIWISEVMLQQTRVAAVLPFYERFLARFPTVRSLARAREHAVLEAWAGLGYYSRARNLQRAARLIVSRHGGRFPRNLEDALALPGVGRYTAAAVLSMAYGAPLAVLDGNVARVLARLGAMRGDVRRPASWKRLEAAAERLLAPASLGAPGAWNQALMELGATVCTPRAPRCGECPLGRDCRARSLGVQEQIPDKRTKRAFVNMRLAAAVLLDPQRRTLLVRPKDGQGDGLFSRMWQFPAVPAVKGAETVLRRHLRDTLGIEAARCLALSPARHTVTFRRITLLPFLVPVEELPEPRPSGDPRGESTQLSLEDVQRWPASSATQKIARAGLRGMGTAFSFRA
jgi:A/G-specific adenine glycosylase